MIPGDRVTHPKHGRGSVISARDLPDRSKGPNFFERLVLWDAGYKKRVSVNQLTLTDEPRDTEEGSTARVLTIDIETRPNLAYVWGIWQENVPLARLVDEKEMISFAAKWLGDDEILFASQFHDGHDAMVGRAHDLLDEADVVVSYNGKRFDIPHINLEFARAGLFPPSPYKQVDLLETTRRKFKFTSNKLEHVAREMGLGGKVQHEGFSLWVECMRDDPDAWEQMRAYNEHDVVLTEKLYLKLRPWVDAHPSIAAMYSDRRCPSCGSKNLVPSEKPYTTRTGSYEQYQCGKCGVWVRDTKRFDRTTVTQTA